MDGDVRGTEENMNRAGVIKNSVKAAIGLGIFSFGLYLTIMANIGLAPWDCLCMGLSMKAGLTYGNMSIIIAVIIVVVDIALKEKIGIGTIFDALLCGLYVDGFTALDIVGEQSGMISGIAVMIAGQFIMAFGQFIYMSAGLGCGPRDALLVAIGKRLRKMPIGAVNVIIYAVFLTAGILLGGPAGVGTVISVFGIGITMQIVFGILKFEPRNVSHIDIVEASKILKDRRK